MVRLGAYPAGCFAVATAVAAMNGCSGLLQLNEYPPVGDKGGAPDGSFDGGLEGGDSSPPPPACTPGTQRPCLCEPLVDGVQTCEQDGSAYGSCICEPSCKYAPPSGPAECPSAYLLSYWGEPCTTLGDVCIYPGAGASAPDGGCAGTAVFVCEHCALCSGSGNAWEPH
jgi:hypothetical protein